MAPGPGAHRDDEAMLVLGRYARMMVVPALAAMVLGLLGALPAHAERIVVRDPAGDHLRRMALGDILRADVDHGRTKVKVTVDFNPDFDYPIDMHVEFNTRGSGAPEFTAFWTIYNGGRDVYVGECALRTGRMGDDHRISLTIPRRCLDNPARFRARVVSTDGGDIADTSRWSSWIARG